MLFPQSMDMTQMSNASTAADNVFRAAICVAIYTAVQTGARTTTAVAYSPEVEDSLLIVLRELTAQGYAVTLAATTVTVVWQ